jgi:hypothetical protein
LEERGQGYVLRVPSTFRLTLARGVTMTCAQAATRLLTGSRRWEVRSAGAGSKGQRWYAWALLATASPRHHLLIRRHLASGELAFHYCYGPEGQPAAKARLIRAAGLRWPVEEGFGFSKSCFGLDQSQVRLSIPRSPATPSWSWPRWRLAPSPLPCCAAAPIPRRRHRRGLISRLPLTRE